MLVGEANSLFAFVRETKPIIATGKNLVKSVKLAHILGKQIATNGSGLGVVALSRNLKLTTTLNRDITQNPCYVP
jgi:hypothetical protein